MLVVIELDVEALVVEAFETAKLDELPNSVVMFAEMIFASEEIRLLSVALVGLVPVPAAFFVVVAFVAGPGPVHYLVADCGCGFVADLFLLLVAVVLYFFLYPFFYG